MDEFGSSQLSTELNSLNSSGMPTPNSGTRPGSQTNSYVQSCASTMSGVDDRKLDEILGDGIQNQVCKKVFSTIGSHLSAKHCTKIHHSKE